MLKFLYAYRSWIKILAVKQKEKFKIKSGYLLRFPASQCLLYFSCFCRNVIGRNADNGIYRSKTSENVHSTGQRLMFLKHSMKWKAFLRGTLSWLNSTLILDFPCLEQRILTICSFTYALKCLIIFSTSICVQICSYMHVRICKYFHYVKRK